MVRAATSAALVGFLCTKIKATPGFSSVDDAWEAFKAQYGKVYNGLDHEAEHRQVYENNMRWAAENSNAEVQFGENQFADLTQAQFQVAVGLGYKPTAEMYGSLPSLGVRTYNDEELAASVDWTTQNAVTPVKTQGQCGASWAFSATGCLEGAWEIASGRLQSLSEQQLVDCAGMRCAAGSMVPAFLWAETHDLVTGDSYPNTGVDSACETTGVTAIPAGGVTGYWYVDTSTEALKSALNLQPVSTLIEASSIAFQMYSGGILKSDSCSTNVDHSVLAVGYGDGFFKMKNSWGTTWGESGYVRISDEGNTCGIHSFPAFAPTVSASVSV